MARCNAKTKTNKRCSNPSKDGSEYCHIHDKTTNEIQHPRKKAMIEALESSLGVVTTACKRVGIDRSTHYEWYKEDELYKRGVDDLKDVAIDFVETQMFKEIKDGSNILIKYYLSTIGKHRGYIERKEHDFRMKTEDWDWDENGDPREYVQQEINN